MEVRSGAGPMAKDDEARLGKENGQILPNVKVTSGSGHRGRDETQTRAVLHPCIVEKVVMPTIARPDAAVKRQTGRGQPIADHPSTPAEVCPGYGRIGAQDGSRRKSMGGFRHGISPITSHIPPSISVQAPPSLLISSSFPVFLLENRLTKLSNFFALPRRIIPITGRSFPAPVLPAR